jgi:hypothetical protein
MARKYNQETRRKGALARLKKWREHHLAVIQAYETGMPSPGILFFERRYKNEELRQREIHDSQMEVKRINAEIAKLEKAPTQKTSKAPRARYGPNRS